MLFCRSQKRDFAHNVTDDFLRNVTDGTFEILDNAKLKFSAILLFEVLD